jgi:hypothetical protein
MANLKEEAERLRIGIRGGWLTAADAVAWADNVIAEASRPDSALLQVASAVNRPREEIATLLAAMPGSADRIAVMRRCLADLLKTLEREPPLARDAARWLEAAANGGELPELAFGTEPTALDEAFGLAEAGVYDTVDSARERLMAFLRAHARSED